MKTAVINFKTDQSTKKKAQNIANQLGIPLSNLLNAYLYELASIGSIHFTVAEPMTEKIEKVIAEAEKEIASGDISDSFENLDELFTHLNTWK